MGLLIISHEFGHFITAKLRGVPVEEFAIGFPPRLFSFKKGETTYSLNLIPLGGYNKLAGEEDPKCPGVLHEEHRHSAAGHQRRFHYEPTASSCSDCGLNDSAP